MKQESDLGAVKSLYVTGLPDGCTEEELSAAFQKLPVAFERTVICDDKVTRPGDTGARRHYAFVHYAKRSEALKALDVRRLSTPLPLALDAAAQRRRPLPLPQLLDSAAPGSAVKKRPPWLPTAAARVDFANSR